MARSPARSTILATRTGSGGARLLLMGTTALLPFAWAGQAWAQAPNAVPTGGQVTAGQAGIQQSGTHTQITQGSDRAIIEWQRFDVGRDATVNFTQPSVNAWTLNRVNTPDPSMIAGQITANGGVAIVNPSGVVFAQGAQVNVGSLVATAAGITNQNFMAGRLVFDGQPNPGARVENHGEITVADRGLVALVAPGTANHGAIRARLGTAIVAGAETYRLDLAGDGLLSIDVTQAVRRAPDGATALVTNSGVIAAEGGQVILTAQAASGLVEAVVRNTGQVTAGRVAIEGRGGNVEIAGGAVAAPGGRVGITAPGAGVTVAAGARVSASAPAGGGRVQLGGNGTARTRVEGRVAARGTATGARGGNVAVQATEAVTLPAGAVVDASGAAGGGEVLVGTTGVGRAQTMARETRVDLGAAVRADALELGHGGLIAVNSLEATSALGDLSAAGGPQGGNGGFVEVSGMQRLTLDMSRVNVRAGLGGAAGTLLIDPVNIIVRSTAAVGPGEVAGPSPLLAAVFTTDGEAGNPTTTIITPAAIQGFAGNVTLEAQQNITVASEVNKPANTLTLQANLGNITVEPGATVTASGLTFTAGGNILLDATISADTGSVLLNAGGSITGTSGVTAGLLRVRGFAGTPDSLAGSLDLTTGNAITTLDARTMGGLTFAQVGDFEVARASSTLGILLGSDGTISGGNVVIGGSLTVRGAGLGATRAGGLALTATGNAVGTLDALTDNAPLTFIQDGALSVIRADAGAGVVALTAIAPLTVLSTSGLPTISGSEVRLTTDVLNLPLTDGHLPPTVSAGPTGLVTIARPSAGDLVVGNDLSAAELDARIEAGTLELQTFDGEVRIAETFSGFSSLILNAGGGAAATVADGVTVNMPAVSTSAGVNLTNSGIITGNAFAGGSLLNAPTLNPLTGIIQGNAEATLNLTNTGSIDGGATAGGTLTNSGTISGNAFAGGSLVNAAIGNIQGNAEATLSLTNHGSITGSATAGNDLWNPGTINAGAGAGNDLGNSGTIDGGAAADRDLGNSGTIGGNVLAGRDVTNTCGVLNGTQVEATTGNVDHQAGTIRAGTII